LKILLFYVFGGMGNFRLETDRLEGMMRDNGWRFELVGSVNVPKSLEVDVANLQLFHVEESFSGLIEERQRGVVVYQERFGSSGFRALSAGFARTR
jgi:hypothetical protein